MGLDACGSALVTEIGAYGLMGMSFGACGSVLAAKINACGCTKISACGF